MNKLSNSKYIILLLVTVFSLTACSLNTDDSGDLGGYWHLTYIDSLATGGHCDMSQEPIYWSVQGKILSVRSVATGEEVMFRYNHNGNTMSLSDARYLNRDIGDEQITDVTVLHPYGINKLEESFEIEVMNGSKIILRSEMLRLYFKKF